MVYMADLARKTIIASKQLIHTYLYVGDIDNENRRIIYYVCLVLNNIKESIGDRLFFSQEKKGEMNNRRLKK
jgi:hypothetical protein